MEAGGLEFLLDPIERLPLREEFTDNFERPDPVPLSLLSPREQASALPANSNCSSGCAHGVGGCSPDRSGGELRRRRNASLHTGR
ncbi:hypothetical protein VPH35_100790 [Triticum aestivum]